MAEQAAKEKSLADQRPEKQRPEKQRPGKQRPGERPSIETLSEEQTLEEQYLEFVSADGLFLLPVAWVGRVIEKKKKPEELPVIDIFGRNREVDGERSLLILLEKGERMAGIAADRVIGIRKVAPERLLKLTEPVINERNRYLEAAAVVEEGGKTGLELVLNPEVLIDGAAAKAAEQSAADTRPEQKSEPV